jgi:hypothetical protein
MTRPADLLYEVINRRYERKPVILTTNRPFKEYCCAAEEEMTSVASLLEPASNPALYAVSALTLYVDLPDTPLRTNTQDQRQARSWFDSVFPCRWSKPLSYWLPCAGFGLPVCRPCHASDR